MTPTRTTCPRCRQPITADIEQLFDVTADPQAKQRFLSGAFNIANCPNCGYQGSVATPIVYHDNSKELLLTFFPPELGLPVNEQERLIGPLISQAVNRLPNEKKKAYILRPQSMFTLQSLIERVLEGDGITKEMIQAQQQRLNLIQRLLSVTEQTRIETLKEEDALVDESTFNIMSRLIEASLSGGDENSARQLAALQQMMLENTTVGKKLHKDALEAQDAAKSLQEATQKGLTREGLLELLINAQSDAALTTITTMARSGMDYEFFQNLTSRIDQSTGDEKTRLETLRGKLLELTQQIDKEIQQHSEQIRQLIEEIIKTPDIEAATKSVFPAVSQLFMDILNGEIQAARQKGDLERSGKLGQIATTIQNASTPPPEYALLEELLEAENEAKRNEILEQNKDMVTEDFIGLISALLTQTKEQDPALTQQLEDVHRVVLKFSMEKNLQK